MYPRFGSRLHTNTHTHTHTRERIKEPYLEESAHSAFIIIIYFSLISEEAATTALQNATTITLTP